MLAGEESDEETGVSSDFQGNSRSALAYLHSPLHHSKGSDAKYGKIRRRERKILKCKLRHNSSDPEDCCEKNMNNHINNSFVASGPLGMEVGGENKFIDGEIVQNHMNQILAIPDIWSVVGPDDCYLVVDDCRVDSRKLVWRGDTQNAECNSSGIKHGGWALGIHSEDGLSRPSPTDLETYYSNTLSGSFNYINTLPLPSLGLVGEVEWEIGFLWVPPIAWEEGMDRNGGRFGGAGRFGRGGRENF